MKIGFGELDLDKKGTLVVGVLEGRTLSRSAEELEKRTGGAISRALKSSKFKGKSGDLLEILAPAKLAASRILLLGLGKPGESSEGKVQEMGGGLAGLLLSYPEAEAHIALDAMQGGLGTAGFAANLALGARLKAYRFDRYRTKEGKEDKPTLDRLDIMLAAASEAKKRFANLDKLADGVVFARDLISEPANVIYPDSFAARMKPLARLGLKVEVLGLAQLKRLGMGALIGVAQGSVRPPAVVVLRWTGARPQVAPIAFVGKGVTFDSGGLSLKTAKGMEDMKWDMAGSAAVVGTMMALAGRKAKVNAVGLVGLVENMPSGAAQRPGDVVKSLSGQTIEVLNTDAEGRLVLADVLWYAQTRFKPAAMINLATLTGAIIVALGHEHAGLFSNNDALAERLLAAGKLTGETLWRMPLGDSYDQQLKSPIADMKNIGDAGSAGSVVAAQFLQRFVQNVPWAHLDIAGVAWSNKERPITPKGAVGWGVRLLDRLVGDYYEAAR
jgi:leucyl aminopeptidase